MFCSTPVMCYFKESSGSCAYCDGCGVPMAELVHPSPQPLLVLGSGPLVPCPGGVPFPLHGCWMDGGSPLGPWGAFGAAGWGCAIRSLLARPEQLVKLQLCLCFVLQ